MSETVIQKLNRLTPARVHAWIVERLENTCRIASTKTGDDRDGWLNDAAYLAGASTLIMKAIVAGAKVDPAAPRATTAWPAPIGQVEATRQEELMDIVQRLHFDAARCEAQFSKGVATNIEEAAAKIERLRSLIKEVHDDPRLPLWAVEKLEAADR